MDNPGIEPNPSTNEETGFDFSTLNPEPVEFSSEDVAPNPKASKPKWWQSRPRKERKPKERKPLAPLPKGGLKPALEKLYAGAGMALMPFDPHCARIVMENASACAESLDELAKTNPAVRNFLVSLVTTSAWSGVIMAHSPIIAAVAMHHIPALREKQEKMVAEVAEMMANSFSNPDDNGKK